MTVPGHRRLRRLELIGVAETSGPLTGHRKPRRLELLGIVDAAEPTQLRGEVKATARVEARPARGRSRKATALAVPRAEAAPALGRSRKGEATATPRVEARPVLRPGWAAGMETAFDFVGDRAFDMSAGVRPLAEARSAGLIAISRASESWVRSASGLWSSVAAAALARSDRGLQLEESRTNYIRNSAMQGAVVGVLGAGGALPTNWVVGVAPEGLSLEVVGLGQEDGLDYIDLRYSGVHSTGNPTFYMEAHSQAVASKGQVWTFSMFVRLVAGSTSGITCNASYTENTGNTVRTSGSAPFVPGPEVQRVSLSRAVSNELTTSVRPRPIFSIPGGATVDFTLRISAPQIELGAHASSPIRTTSGAVTRAADVVTVPGLHADLTQGSMCIEWHEELGATGALRMLWTARASAGHLVRATINADGCPELRVLTASSSVAVITATNPVVAGNTYRMAARWIQDDVAAVFSPSLRASLARDTVAAMPTGLATGWLGENGAGSAQLNGLIRRFGGAERALGSAELEALVA